MQEYERAVLEKYDMDVTGTRKTRGAILCDTDQGILLLKEVQGTAKRIPVLCGLYDALLGQGYENVDYIIRTKEGACVAEMEDGGKYILKRWFAGRECEVRRPGELLAAAGMLAKLHIVMRGNFLTEHQPPAPECPPECLPEEECVRHDREDPQRNREHPPEEEYARHDREDPQHNREHPLEEEYARHNRELCKVRKFVRKLSPKGEFEYAFLRCFDQMYLWAQAAEEKLADSGYRHLAADSREKGCLVHGEYNYHNILVLQAESGQEPGREFGRREQPRIAVTGFEKFKQGIQAEDLYYFLRKVMEKQGWKVRLGDNMLNAYSAIRPLSEEEMQYLCLRFVYPEKFWKTADSYYRSNKVLLPAKSLEKLETAIRQTEEKKRFLEEIFSFHL